MKEGGEMAQWVRAISVKARGSVRSSAPIQKLNMVVCAHNQCWEMEGIKTELVSPLGVHRLISKRI